MDLRTKLKDYFLSCNICTDIFENPCTLACQHTFCRRCLTKNMKYCREAIIAKSIQCPNCRQMTKVPEPEESVQEWAYQIKPAFLIQGLLDTFASNVESTLQVEADTVVCKEHNCLVQFCCNDCKKAVCEKCGLFYHRKCKSVCPLDSIMSEMKQKLHQQFDDMKGHMQQTEINLKKKRSEVWEITQDNSSLQSDISRVSQQAVDLIRRKEQKLLDELYVVTKKQTDELKDQIKAGENDLQMYQKHIEYIQDVLQSNILAEMYHVYAQRNLVAFKDERVRLDMQKIRTMKVQFETRFDVNQFDSDFQVGHLKYANERGRSQMTPKILSKVNIKAEEDDNIPYPYDIEVLNTRGYEILVVTDNNNACVKSCYTKSGKPYCKSLTLDSYVYLFVLTKLSKDTVAVSNSSNRIEVIELTPDPVLISSISTKKRYVSLAALTDTTLAAGCADPPSIDVLDRSGIVLISVSNPSPRQKLIQTPEYMCSTSEGDIVVVDRGSHSVYCVTQQGEFLFRRKLTEGYLRHGGVTTTDNGSVIVADRNSSKIFELNKRGEFVRNLLTGREGLVGPQGIRVHNGKLYVSEEKGRHVKIFEL